MNVLQHKALDNIQGGNIERAALWEYPTDSIYVSRYIRTLQDLTKEIKYNATRSIELYRRLKAIKHKTIQEFESKIDRIWNDQKAGTTWDMAMCHKEEPFRPHQVVEKANTVTWDGLALFVRLIAQETDSTPHWIADGTGTADTTFGDQSMGAEVARIDINELGDFSAEGTVLKFTGAFPTGVPNNTISEFGGFDADVENEGTMVYHTVIDKPEDMLAHIQNRTIIQSSHSIEFVAVENKIE
jgi:hypothetical protein